MAGWETVVTALATGGGGAALASYVLSKSTWLVSRLSDSVAARLQASYQHDLDRQLEHHRATLAADGERLRAHLSKELADYGLWASRRHEAIARLSKAFLDAELTMLGQGKDDSNSHEVDANLGAIQAREALFAEYIYLPEKVEEAAQLVRKAMEDYFLEVKFPTQPPSPFTNAYSRRQDVRSAIEHFQREARAELMSSVTPLNPVPSPPEDPNHFTLSA